MLRLVEAEELVAGILEVDACKVLADLLDSLDFELVIEGVFVVGMGLVGACTWPSAES